MHIFRYADAWILFTFLASGVCIHRGGDGSVGEGGRAAVCGGGSGVVGQRCGGWVAVCGQRCGEGAAAPRYDYQAMCDRLHCETLRDMMHALLSEISPPLLRLWSCPQHNHHLSDGSPQASWTCLPGAWSCPPAHNTFSSRRRSCSRCVLLLLTGEKPWQGDGQPTACAHIVHTHPPCAQKLVLGTRTLPMPTTPSPCRLQSFMLALGQHPDMLEDMVYFLIFLPTAGTALFTLGEIAWPESFLATCGRLYCTFLQSIW